MCEGQKCTVFLYWSRSMSSHHVQKLFRNYQDPDIANLLLMFWAVFYAWVIKHENFSMETVHLCLCHRALYLSTMRWSFFNKKKHSMDNRARGLFQSKFLRLNYISTLQYWNGQNGQCQDNKTVSVRIGSGSKQGGRIWGDWTKACVIVISHEMWRN